MSGTASVTDTENSKENESCVLQPHLLEYVFKYLETSDLQSAALVNSIWEDVAKWELQNRISPGWFRCCGGQKFSSNTSPGINYNTTAVAVVVVHIFENNMTPRNRCSPYIVTKTKTKTKELCFPGIGQYVLPASPEYFMIKCYAEHCETLFEGVLIPFIPNIRTTTFYCNLKLGKVPNYINNEEEVKCLLMFPYHHKVLMDDTLLKLLLNGKNPETVAIGGGVIKSAYIKNETSKNLIRNEQENVFCIAFLQEQEIETNFNAYSVAIINYENGTVDEYVYKLFEIELIKFKETCILRKYGIVFMFSCHPRTFKHNETAIIKKHFSKYNLMSLNVLGEIGWNTCNTQENESDAPPARKKFKIDVPNTIRGLSTVLVLITWGIKL